MKREPARTIPWEQRLIPVARSVRSGTEFPKPPCAHAQSHKVFNLLPWLAA